MIIETHKHSTDDTTKHTGQQWIVGESLEIIADWRSPFFMAHSSVIHYLGVVKPIIIFPITYVPDNHSGILFDRIYIIDPVRDYMQVSQSIIFVNKEFLDKCMPEDSHPFDYLCESYKNLNSKFLQECVLSKGAMLVGIHYSDKRGA